ncbi:HAD-IA family hydrolase [Yinghuangia sp. YIM S09857]|uniref:HAD-IA family hydrolase n=1 Tax=Yinghuangia sp. YIM S09857 TaxID=3436929 RepID=UPI003F539B99
MNEIVGAGLRCSAVLFDLDGVLVDSHPTIERILREWAIANGVDPDVAVAESQGRRDVDLVALVAPHLNAEEGARELIAREARDFDGIAALPGAAELLRALPTWAWTVVTSGARAVARGRLAAAGLPVPDAFVAAEDVAAGKPDPECYLRGAALLGADPADCLVFEDAEAGLLAAGAAGMRAIAVGKSAVGLHAPWEDRVGDLREVAVEAAVTGGPGFVVRTAR